MKESNDDSTVNPDDTADQSPFILPIDGILDLHQFQPREIEKAVGVYIEACVERGISAVRIIHGKGIGAQREQVHALLRKLPAVISFRLDSGASSWGATLVDLDVNKTNG